MEIGNKRTLIHFSDDMQPYEIRAYEAYIPQTVKYQRKGSTLIIETPIDFAIWLEPAVKRSHRLLDRFTALLGIGAPRKS
jgi:hypothetical protein